MSGTTKVSCDKAMQTDESGEKPDDKKPVQPDQIALPLPDSDERSFHDETLAIEEERREHASIPPSFTAKYLWLASERSMSSPSASDPYGIPDTLQAEARAAIQNAFSLESQTASIATAPPCEPWRESSFRNDESPTPSSPLFGERLRSDKPIIDEPIVTFFCPYDYTSGVIDTLVQSVGESEGCDVVVLDPIFLAQGSDGPLGAGTSHE